MAAKIERTYYARVDEILKLMKKKGHSLDSLAKAAPVSPVTLGRLLNRNKKKRRPGVIATFKKIADKLGVAPDTLIEGYQPESEASSTRPDATRLQPALDLAKAFDEFDETIELSKLFAKLTTIIGARATVYVIAINPGDSVIIHISIHIADFEALLFYALRGKLAKLGVKSIILPRNNATVSAVLSKYESALSAAAGDIQIIRFADNVRRRRSS